MTFKVLSIDGGGMRGIYSAAYLAALEEGYRKRRASPVGLDIGKAFDLIVGTSTGAIIGCALAAGIGADRMEQLYRQHGAAIFAQKIPSALGWNLLQQLWSRPKLLASGDQALRKALENEFQTETLAELWKRRQIAVAVPAVNMATHRSWVFKTPHDPQTNHRDDNYTLVDVCRASSAAPLFRSLAAIKPVGATGPADVFTDGGLWANNPVVVALLEALTILDRTDNPETRESAIEIYCLGSCGKPEGDVIRADEVHRGLAAWKFGGEAARVSLGAQEFAFDFVARSMCRHLKRSVRIVRFPTDKIPASLMEYLDLDETRPDALDALVRHARQDANMTNSQVMSQTDDGRLIESLFTSMPSR
jgi:hypothetical protein